MDKIHLSYISLKVKGIKKPFIIFIAFAQFNHAFNGVLLNMAFFPPNLNL